MKRLILALTVVVGAWLGLAQATPIFSDDFDVENGSTDNTSALLDNNQLYQLTTRVHELPEHGSLLLMGTGMLYIARRVRRSGSH